MRRAEWVHENPTVLINEREFLVDFGTKEFRCVGDVSRRIDFSFGMDRVGVWFEGWLVGSRGS